MTANAIEQIRAEKLHIMEGAGTVIPGGALVHAENCPGCKIEPALARVDTLLQDMKRIERMAGAAGYGETPAKPIAEIARAAVCDVTGEGA